MNTQLREKFILYMQIKYSPLSNRHVTMKDYKRLEKELRDSGFTEEIELQLMHEFFNNPQRNSRQCATSDEMIPTEFDIDL